jgi:hypothetical protein
MTGEIAEMMLDGTMCEGCGEFLDDGNDGPGFPQLCESCRRARARFEKSKRAEKRKDKRTSDMRRLHAEGQDHKKTKSRN